MCARPKWLLKVREEVDLRGIYINEEARSGKIPARYPTKILVVRFTSRSITWGIGSRKNLLRAHLERLNVRSVPWAVKKTSSLAEMGYREHKATIMTSKSFFLPKETERRILRGYYKGIKHRSPLFIYVLGLRPKPMTRDRSRRDNRYQVGPC